MNNLDCRVTLVIYMPAEMGMNLYSPDGLSPHNLGSRGCKLTVTL